MYSRFLKWTDIADFFNKCTVFISNVRIFLKSFMPPWKLYPRLLNINYTIKFSFNPLVFRAMESGTREFGMCVTGADNT